MKDNHDNKNIPHWYSIVLAAVIFTIALAAWPQATDTIFPYGRGSDGRQVTAITRYDLNDLQAVAGRGNATTATIIARSFVSSSPLVAAAAINPTAIDLQTQRALSTEVASGEYATISGGRYHTANGSWSTITGGHLNHAVGNYSTIGGGALNTATGFVSSVTGGINCFAAGHWSSILGGNGNYTIARYSAIINGVANKTSGPLSATIGGYRLIADSYGMVAIGQFNLPSNSDTGEVIEMNLERPVIVVGNGTSETARSNAYVVYFDGSTSQTGKARAEGGVETLQGGITTSGSQVMYAVKQSANTIAVGDLVVFDGSTADRRVRVKRCAGFGIEAGFPAGVASAVTGDDVVVVIRGPVMVNANNDSNIIEGESIVSDYINMTTHLAAGITPSTSGSPMKNASVFGVALGTIPKNGSGLMYVHPQIVYMVEPAGP